MNILYYGTDLMNLAEKLGVTWRGLKKRLMKWLKEDMAFIGLHYLGNHKPSITLNEFIEIENRIVSNPLVVKSHIYSDINKERETSGKESIAKPTFYRAARQTHIEKYPWFARKFIKLPSLYSVHDARDSLSTLFTYSDLKAYGGADIQAISYEKGVGVLPQNRLGDHISCFREYSDHLISGHSR